MSLRDWFAGMAMQSMVSMFREEIRKEPEARPAGIVQTTAHLPENVICSERIDWESADNLADWGIYDKAISESAYMIANAMLAEREKADG
jgi:hypothetical protein